MPNKLYKFIKHESFKSIPASNIFAPERFQPKVNEDKKNYVLYELDVPKEKSIELNNAQFTLKTHHLSIPEISFEKGEYHYTAYFENNGKTYQLHVYFYKKEEIYFTSDLKDEETGKYIAQDPGSLAVLTQFAIDQSLTVIQELRRHQTLFINDLKKDYEESNDQLLKLSTDMNGAYKEKFKVTIQLLEQLTHYANEKQYKALLKLSKHIQSSLESKQTQLEEPSHQEEITTNTIEDLLPEIATKPLTQLSKKTKTKSLPIQEVVKAAEKYRSENINSENKLSAFLEFHKSVSAILALTENPEYAATTEDLLTLRKLTLESQAEAKKLLTRFLLSGKFDLALALKEFLKPEVANLVNIALTANKPDLLDFLLTHSNYPINTCLINGMSPVLYCFTNATKIAPKLLSVLIKHNASIMVKGKDGFPAVMHILNLSHPLFSALSENTDKTFAKPGFYQEIAKAVKDYIVKNNITGKEKKKWEAFVKNYELRRDATAQYSTERGPKTAGTIIKSYLKTGEQITHAVSKELIEEMGKDEDFIESYKKYLLALKTFRDKLPKNTRRQFEASKDPEEIKEILSDIFDQLKENNEINIKECVLENLAGKTRILELRTELLDAQAVIKSNKKNNKALKRADAKQRVLLKEIKELVRKYHLSESEIDQAVEHNNGLKVTSALQEVLDSTTAINKALTLMKKGFTLIEEGAAEMSKRLEHTDTTDDKQNEFENMTAFNLEKAVDLIAMGTGFFNPSPEPSESAKPQDTTYKSHRLGGKEEE